jgi:hypothetical protein
MSRQPDQRIVAEVMRYFLTNPSAADTLEGIARWRLLEARVSENIADTRSAIAWLVANGYLKQLSSTAADPLFQLNAEARARAEELVAAGAGTNGGDA